jgi:hypothetical protein
MGGFNDWVRGSYLSEPNQRHVVDVADQIMKGTAFLYRSHSLKMQGLQMPAYYSQYQPIPSILEK